MSPLNIRRCILGRPEYRGSSRNSPATPGRPAPPIGQAHQPQARSAAASQPSQKRAPEAACAVALADKRAAPGIAIVVHTSGIHTPLAGEYKEHSVNHGRKVYQKASKIPGHQDVQVFLYYWDARDGADFSG